MNTRKAACFIVFIVGLLLCFTGFKKICAVYSAVSYRFLQPVTIKDEKSKATVSVTYWQEENKLITANYKSSNATAIGVYGNPFLCYPMEFINGGLGGGQNVCGVSSALAFKLFNSLDVIGLKLKLGNREYLISGVFNSKSDVLVYSAPKNSSFNNIEIEAPLQKANETLQSEMQKTPNYIIDGQVIRTVFGAILILPIITGAIRLVIIMFKAAKNKEKFVFILCLAIACSLPFILNALPSFLVPAKWSDFSFYEAIAQNAQSALNHWFMLPPFLKDAAAKGAMLQCIIASLASALACVAFLKAEPKY